MRYLPDQETDEVYELYSRVVSQTWNVASGQWDGPANWDQGEVPDEVMAIHVNPVSFLAATVTGPVTDTSIFPLVDSPVHTNVDPAVTDQRLCVLVSQPGTVRQRLSDGQDR